METFLIITGIVLVFTLPIIFAWRKEARNYNNGQCPDCDTKLERFGVDINREGEENRFYSCKNCGYIAKCSYPVDMK